MYKSLEQAIVAAQQKAIVTGRSIDVCQLLPNRGVQRYYLSDRDRTASWETVLRTLHPNGR